MKFCLNCNTPLKRIDTKYCNNMCSAQHFVSIRLEKYLGGEYSGTNQDENDRPDNLQILCPNCHSLTETYGALNRGKGRKRR